MVRCRDPGKAASQWAIGRRSTVRGRRESGRCRRGTGNGVAYGIGGHAEPAAAPDRSRSTVFRVPSVIEIDYEFLAIRIVTSLP